MRHFKPLSKPGLAKAEAMFDEVAREMSGRPADDVHAELVNRLESEPFAWDDNGLREIARSIGDTSASGARSNDKASDPEEDAGSHADSAETDPPAPPST